MRTWGDQAWIIRVLGRTDDAARLLAVIEPYRDLWVADPLWLNLPMAVGVAECEVMVGEHEAAAGSAVAAWQALVENNVRCHLPHAAIRLADVLNEVGTTETRTEARRMLDRGLRDATDMGMDRRVTEIEARLR